MTAVSAPMRPAGQWALLNLLRYRSGLDASTRTAAGLLYRLDTTAHGSALTAVTDLDELREAGLLIGRRADGGLVCPECGEPVRNQAPSAWGMPEFVVRPRRSHKDGTPLCPAYGGDGVTPATPVLEVPNFSTLDRHELRRTTVGLTAAGRVWCDTDPHNRVISAADVGQLLAHMAAVWGLDFQAMAECGQAGLIDVVEEDGRPVRFDRSLLASAAMSTRGGARLTLTRAGRRLVP